MFDIIDYDNDCLQYTVYNQGDYYNWHTDSNLGNHSVISVDKSISSTSFTHIPYTIQPTNLVRKLSFSLLLSDPHSDFTGGNLRFHNGISKPWEHTTEKGSLIIFDSTLYHKVTKVKSGTRKSLVGWVLGPRWK